ncbi:MAG: helix-turn-helix transcriptional regulator [Candidatus Eremiobacteraeota bacterium]|nr:helix-turn-helix transcriptional regulator [Candidatus Eremiobacteraeota bacterium]
MSRLKLRRLRSGKTQAEEAQRVGISVSLFRELEAARAAPSDRVAELLEAAYGTPAKRLLGLG